jgi:predicted PurR-regulated permease PerM
MVWEMFITIVYTVIFFFIVYGVTLALKRVRKNKSRYKHLRLIYITAGFACFWGLFFFPVRQLATFRQYYNVWERYQQGQYKEFKGVLDRNIYSTTYVEVTLNDKVQFQARTHLKFCFSFSGDTGFDLTKTVYLRYIPFGQSNNTAYCVVYAEQDVPPLPSFWDLINFK